MGCLGYISDVLCGNVPCHRTFRVNWFRSSAFRIKVHVPEPVSLVQVCSGCYAMTIHEVVTVLCKSGCKRGLFRDMTSNIVLEAENLVIWNWLTVKTETGRLERNKCQDNSSLLVNKENMQHWARTCKLFSFRKLEIICSSKLTIFLKLHFYYLYNLWAYFAKNGSYCCTFMFQIFLGMLAKSI